jgi:hypothetical protein
MTLNYVLLAITGILSLAGIIEIARRGSSAYHPLRFIGALLVFALVLAATLKGVDYAAFKITVESALKPIIKSTFGG